MRKTWADAYGRADVVVPADHAAGASAAASDQGDRPQHDTTAELVPTFIATSIAGNSVEEKVEVTVPHTSPTDPASVPFGAMLVGFGQLTDSPSAGDTNNTATAIAKNDVAPFISLSQIADVIGKAGCDLSSYIRVEVVCVGVCPS
jgi:hypothetical protein